MDLDQPQQGSRCLLGCILVPVVLIAAFLTLSTLGFTLALLFGGRTTPFAGKIGLGVVSIAFNGLLAAFFLMVAKRMIAGLRGKPVPHLIPPVVGAIVGAFFGLMSLFAAIASLTGAIVSSTRDTGRALGAVVLFFGFAVMSVRSMLRHREAQRRKAREAEPPGAAPT